MSEYIERNLEQVIDSLIEMRDQLDGVDGAHLVTRNSIELILELAVREVRPNRDEYFKEIDRLSEKYGVTWHIIRRKGGSFNWKLAPLTHGHSYTVAHNTTIRLNQEDTNYWYQVATTRRCVEIGAI